MIRAGRLSLDLFKACWSGHCLSVSVWNVRWSRVLIECRSLSWSIQDWSGSVSNDQVRYL